MVADPPAPSENPSEEPGSDDEVPAKENAQPPDDDPTPSPTPPRKSPDPLANALEAPEDAITSRGRFDALMQRGLSEYMPQIGLLYGAGGVDQPGLRVAIAADGRGRWARGDGPFWGELAESGDFELSDEQTAALAELVTKAWAQKVDYPASSVKQTRVIILRDGETSRVFEHSSVPDELARVEELLREHVPENNE
jgi:hypothetical protein